MRIFSLQTLLLIALISVTVNLPTLVQSRPHGDDAPEDPNPHNPSNPNDDQPNPDTPDSPDKGLENPPYKQPGLQPEGVEPEGEEQPAEEPKGEEQPAEEPKGEEQPEEEGPKSEEQPAEQPEAKGEEQPPEEGLKGEEQPAEEPKGEEQPAEEPKGEEQPAEQPEAKGEEQPPEEGPKGEEQPVEEPKGEEQPAEEPKGEEQPAEQPEAKGEEQPKEPVTKSKDKKVEETKKPNETEIKKPEPKPKNPQPLPKSGESSKTKQPEATKGKAAVPPQPKKIEGTKTGSSKTVPLKKGAPSPKDDKTTTTDPSDVKDTTTVVPVTTAIPLKTKKTVSKTKPNLKLIIDVIGDQVKDNTVEIQAHLGNLAKSLSFDFDLKLKLRCECKKCAQVLGCTDDCGQATLNSKSKDPVVFKKKLLNNGNIRIRVEVLNKEEIESLVEVTKCHFTHGLRVGNSVFFGLLSKACGWIYLVSWMIAFYPQVISNFNKKSVVGLNFDFVFLNLTGYIFYSVYNLCLFFSVSFQADYFTKNPNSDIPVEVNDVIFSLHGVFITGILAIQCLFYERGGQTITAVGKHVLNAVYAPAVVLIILFCINGIDKFYFISFFSSVKLGLAVFKYTPQVYQNYARKSTKGWSVYYCYLDISGGSFSFLQMFLMAYNQDDWCGLFSNFGKLGLGLLSIMYDLIFLYQHFLYKDNEDMPEYCDLKENTNGIVRRSITINNQCINQFSNLRPVQESHKENAGIRNHSFDEDN